MRKITGLFIVVASLASIQVVFPNAAFGLIELITGSNKVSAAHNAAPSLPRVADKGKPGFPHVNYDDPSVAVRAEVNSANSPAIVGATADFDSDGVQDLIAVDAGGRFTFFKGNADTIYPNSPEAKLRRVESGDPTAFSKAVPDQSLPVSPDFLSAGDFNADGLSDILAAVRGSNILYLAAGDGSGRFSLPRAVVVEGQITALETGEIGRPDQQTDIAVAYVNKGSSFVAIYEHPEGAFARKPEVFTLPSAVGSLAIGNLDKDPYADVAAGSGYTLTLIHGRGQAYPLDLKADLDIQRPPAFVQSKYMPFSIADLAIGRFGKERGDSIAALSTDGRISLLEPLRNEIAVTTNKLTRDQIRETKFTAMQPVGADTGNYGVIKNDVPKTEAEADERGQIMADAAAIKEDREKVFSDKFADLQREWLKRTPAEQAKKLSDDIQKTFDTTKRRKEVFEATLAPKPVLFSKFTIEMIAADPSIAAAVSTSRANKLIKGRFSDSGLDDLAIIDAVTNNIHIVGKWRGSQSKQTSQANIVSINVVAGSTAIVPMRLNADALSDIVVLGAGEPSVMMSLPAVTLTVNSTDADSGGDCVTPNTVCTLRRALFLANTNLGGTTLIAFDIPGTGVQTLHPTSNFPDINKQTTIDGTTQPGFAGSPLIEISGDLMTGGHEGLKIKASNSLVRGLAINQIPSVFDDNNSQVGGSGITILSTSSFQNVGNVIIEGNFLGTDPTGETKKANDANGVHIYDADGNTVGGTTAQARNILSGNGNPVANKQGVGLAITGGHNNFIYGNYIGTNSLGNIKVGNSYGVFLTGINNKFGGDAAGEGNVVSGNGGPVNSFGQCQGGGIYTYGLISLEDGSLQTDSNILKGNKIGTTADGVGPLGNCGVGISSPSDVNTTIGSIAQNGRNVISDNGWDALYCGYASQSTFGLSGACYIIGNNIGTDITGTTAMRNDQRNNSCIGFCLITDTVWTTPSDLAFVIVGSPGGTSPGGDCTGMCNLISGNNDPGGFGGGGLYRSGYGFVFAVNNYLGVNRSGTTALPNRQGFNSYYGSFVFGAELSDGNGGTIDGGNIASGNDQSGTSTTAIVGGGTFEIRGNIVGLSADGNSSIGNGVGGTSSCGICARSYAGTSTAIGGTGNLQRNFIAAETSDPYYNGTRGTGLSVATSPGGLMTVFNNWIGLNKSGNLAGNSGNGIEVSGDGRTRIGGYGYNEMNFVIGNGRAGVVVSQFTHPQTGISPAKNVSITRNAIAINGGLGIDLVEASLSDPYPAGVTTNDCFDADDGPNGKQNFPELFPPVINGNGTVSIPTTLRSLPASQYTIDYYQSPAADPSTYGEGSNYIGSVNVQTDGNGFAGLTFTSADPIIPTQLAFTATATDDFGNTSEFSCAAGVCTTGTFQQAMERPEVTCVEPFVVNIDTDEIDANISDGLCDIDTGNTGLQCSLRAAIQQANANSGYDVINFAIPGGGVHTLTPMTSLPVITEPVTVNGPSQSGYIDSPLIEIRGDAGNLNVGIAIAADGAKVSGLTINRCVTAGIAITGSSNIVESSFIGTNADGITADTTRKQTSGIAISGGTSRLNMIGGPLPSKGNVISNSGFTGIFLSGNTRSNLVINNKIGTDKTGMAALPNQAGVSIESSNENVVGGTIDEDTNQISGNTGVGVFISSGTSNRVSGNLIGTDPTGNSALPNGGGITIGPPAANNTIGGSTAQRNIISGNNTGSGTGIDFSRGAGQNTITGNYIGTNKAGDSSVANIWGVSISASNVSLGSSTSSPNIISGNNEGIVVSSAVSQVSNVNVVNNRIGTNASGTADIPNREGVVIFKDVSNCSISRNLISGNTKNGILVFGENNVGPTNTTISENLIGTKLDGTNLLSNDIGVALINGTHDSVVTKNTISGNIQGGIQLGGGPSLGRLDAELSKRLGGIGNTYYLPTTNNKIIGNRIGTSQSGNFALGNGKAGVFLAADAFDNFIGGKRSAAEGNVISGNSYIPGIGIAIGALNDSIYPEDYPHGNFIQGNRIGIKLGSYAPLPNIVGIKIKFGNNNTIGGDGQNCTPANQCDIADYSNIIGCNTQQGIWLEGPSAAGNSIVSNFVGVAPDGTAIGNGSDGIHVNQASGTTIVDNTIGNSGANGILVEGNAPALSEASEPPVKREPDGSIGLSIKGNSVGLFKALGLDVPAVVPNLLAGIKVLNASNVLIGDDVTGARQNVISGNIGPGILIEGQNSFFNRINNSIIGTDSEGRLGLGNGGDGVKILNAPNNVIGDEAGDPSRDTTIAGNAGDGVSIEGLTAQFNSLNSTAVGILDIQHAMSVRIANGRSGVAIVNAPNNTIGGAMPGAPKNVISGNAGPGVSIEGPNSYTNQIINSIIGTDIAGTLGIGNGGDGVKIVDAPNNVIGDSAGGPGRDTTIAGNAGNGVSIEGLTAQFNSLYSTMVGIIKITEVNQTVVLRAANGGSGVSILNAPNNTIGGINSTQGNEISGNTGSGILISGLQATGNSVKRNLVGNNPIGSAFGNTLHGIHLTGGASNNTIGGDNPNDGNIIGGNGGSGIFIEDGEPAPRTEITQSTKNNRFTRNNIFGNFGLGIDIFPTGANPNDPGDGDEGPSRGQNHPVIDSFSIDGNGDLLVTYILDTDVANANYGSNGIYIQFFKSDATGQGQFFLNSDYWTQSDQGAGSSKTITLGNAAAIGFTLADLMTATATDADGNTSEFVPTGTVPTPTATATSTPTETATETFTPTPPPVITGTITYGNAVGSPSQRFVSGVQLDAVGSILISNVTAPDGTYLLEGFGSGAYTITPFKNGGQNAAISSFDAALIGQHVGGPPLPHLTGNQLIVADVSGNGTLSSFDAAMVASYVVSLPGAGSSGNWIFNPVSYTHASVNSNITGENYTALLFGDVSGNWNDPISLPVGRTTAGSGPEREIAITAPHLAASAGREIILPIRVDGVANKGIIAYEFDLRYDPYVIRPQESPVDIAETVSSHFTAVSNTETPGLLRVAVYGTMPLNGNGLLFSLKFTAVGQPGAESPLRWERVMFNEGDLGTTATDGMVEIMAAAPIRLRSIDGY